MKLIAIGTVQGAKVVRKPDPTKPGDKGEYKPMSYAPGMPLDSAELGMSDEEAQALVDSGAAREAPSQSGSSDSSAASGVQQQSVSQQAAKK